MVLDATIDGMSVKELKALITDGGLRFQDCTEKSELKARAREANEQLLQRMWEVSHCTAHSVSHCTTHSVCASLYGSRTLCLRGSQHSATRR